MTKIIYRITALLIGYACGNFLTAEIVTRRLTGQPCSKLGKTGNPGMANVMSNLGFKAGITVLAGDVIKTALAMGISYAVFKDLPGRTAVFYAGFGAVLGHDFPAWQKFKGGKGVACCCTLLILFSPWGLLAAVIGMATVFITGYLCIGGIVIPAAFILPAFFVYGKEVGCLSIILTLLSALKHWPVLKTVPSGQCEKTDIIGQIKSKIKK